MRERERSMFHNADEQTVQVPLHICRDQQRTEIVASGLPVQIRQLHSLQNKYLEVQFTIWNRNRIDGVN